MLLLRAATASRMREEEFSRQQEIAATSPRTIPKRPRSRCARGATLLHRAWGSANEARTKLRYAWHEFFKRFDVLLTPVAATAAFPHNRNPNRDERTVSVNGKSAAVRGAAVLCGSPVVLPAGNRSADRLLTAEGLPVACRSSAGR